MIARALLGCVVVAGATGCSESSSTADARDAGASGGKGGSVASGGAGFGGGTAGSPNSGGGSGGVVGPPSLARVGDTFDIPALEAAKPVRFVDVGYDPTRDVYLVVNGNTATSGSFLDPDGKSIAAPFSVSTSTAYGQGSRLGYGKDADGFLVAWHDLRNGTSSPEVYARIVRWNGSAPAFAGPDFKLSDGNSYGEAGTAIAYSETSKVFLAAWHAKPNDDIHARLLSPTGAPIGSLIVVTNDAGWQSDASIAWNPERDEFLLAYTSSVATNQVHFTRIKASDGSLVGDPVPLAEAGGTWLTQAAFVPALGKYVLAWFEGKLMVRGVSQDGVPEATPFELAPGYGAYDGFAMAFQPYDGNFAATFHGATDEDWACAFNADGTQTPPFEATSSAGTEGHFNPRIAANSKRGEWLLVTSLGFASVVGQRLGR